MNLTSVKVCVLVCALSVPTVSAAQTAKSLDDIYTAEEFGEYMIQRSGNRTWLGNRGRYEDSDLIYQMYLSEPTQREVDRADELNRYYNTVNYQNDIVRELKGLREEIRDLNRTISERVRNARRREDNSIIVIQHRLKRAHSNRRFR